MSVNVGNFDRAARFVLGLVLLALGYLYGNWWGLIGLVPIGTAVFGRCALYSLLGVTTCKMKEKPAES